jgi:hypothetical protein
VKRNLTSLAQALKAHTFPTARRVTLGFLTSGGILNLVSSDGSTFFGSPNPIDHDTLSAIIARGRTDRAEGFPCKFLENRGGGTRTRTEDTMIFSHVRRVSGHSWRFQTPPFGPDSSMSCSCVFQVVALGYCQTTVNRNHRSYK